MSKNKNKKSNRVKRIANPHSSVANLISITSIRDGIIKTTDARYLKLFEVLPINFEFRSSDEKYSVISNFFGLFYSVKNIIQFKIISKETDTFEHEESIINAESKDPTHCQKEFLEKYLDFVRNLGHKHSISRRFFVIIQYVPEKEHEGDFLKIRESLDFDYSLLSAAFQAAGNEVKEDFDSYEVLNFETNQALYYILNPRSSMVETFSDRFTRVVNDFKKQLNTDDSNIINIPVYDLIAPRGVEFKKDYSVVDGQYQTFFYIPSAGYPKHPLPVAWASSFLTFGDGINFDIFLRKLNRADLTSKLFIAGRTTKVSMIDLDPSNTENAPDIIQKAYSIDFLKNALQNNQDVFDMSILFTIHAKTLKDLRKKAKNFSNQIKAMGYTVYPSLFDQETFYKATLPLCDPSLVEKKTHRNIHSEGIACSYPFTAYEMTDNDGVLTGINDNGFLLIQNLFNRSEYKNANMVILGSSGSGKTFLMQMLAGRYRLRQNTVYAILPLKGSEFKRGVLKHGGVFSNMNPGGKDCLNILEIQPYDTSIMIGTDEEIQQSKEEATSLLAAKIEQVCSWFSLLKEDLTDEDFILLTDALMETYNTNGITHDNESLYDEDGNLKKMPILDDLYYNLTNHPNHKRLTAALYPFVLGNSKKFNGQTNIDLNNKYIVFDISDAPERLLPAYMFIVLDFVWNKARIDKTENKIIILDEVWKLMNQNERAAKFVLEIFKIIRGYGGGAWAATQDISDFFAFKDGVYGKGILDAARTKILLATEEKESHFVKEVMDLTEQERLELSTTKERGSGFICCNNNRIKFHGRPTEFEKTLYTTDAKELSDIKAEQEKQKNKPQQTDITDIMGQLPGSKTLFSGPTE